MDRRRGEVTPPYGCNAGGAQQTGRCRHRPLRPAGDGTPGRRALRVVAESRRDCPGQRRTAERLRRDREERVEIGAGIIPKVSSNLGQSLSQPAADSSLYTREPFPAGDGGCGLPRCSAPRNDSPDLLSFRGGPTGRRGNPSFLRWTGGSGRRSRRPLRKVYRSPSNRPMWASAPTGGCRELPRPPGQRLAKRKARG